VLIGPGTVRAEGYGRLVGVQRRADVPPAVLISRRFNIPWGAGLFEAPDQPVIVYGPHDAPEPPPVAAPVEIVRLEQCTPAAALADLRARGIRSLLSEGGPTLFHGFLAAGYVDELFLTLTPLMTGDEQETGVLSGARLAAPAQLELRWVLRAEQELFLRYACVR
jgi:riboflavin biosynthesis pyrimidine reductase